MTVEEAWDYPCSVGQKITLLALIHCSKGRIVYVPQARLEKITGLSSTTLLKHLAWIQDEGFIRPFDHVAAKAQDSLRYEWLQ